MTACTAPKFNPHNERTKYKYRIHLKCALRKDEKTLLAALKHIRQFEIFAKFEGFTAFNDVIANKYVDYQFDKEFSLSHINDNLRVLKEFLKWLERQRGYRGKINYNHIDYLNISHNQRRTAKASEYKTSYPYEQIIKTIRGMPSDYVIENRNKAVISLQALCGLRIGELCTVKIKNIIEEEGVYFIHVNPKDMRVKFAKTRQANFMPLPQDIIDNVINWRDYLVKQGFSRNDPLFPQIKSQFNQLNMLESKLSHTEIKSDTTIRSIFENAFKAAGYEYIRPHSFRHTMVRYAERQSPEFMNAVRQSLGHSSIDTTFSSYGQLSEFEQRRRISTGNTINSP